MTTCEEGATHGDGSDREHSAAKRVNPSDGEERTGGLGERRGVREGRCERGKSERVSEQALLGAHPELRERTGCDPWDKALPARKEQSNHAAGRLKGEGFRWKHTAWGLVFGRWR